MPGDGSSRDCAPDGSEWNLWENCPDDAVPLAFVVDNVLSVQEWMATIGFDLTNIVYGANNNPEADGSLSGKNFPPSGYFHVLAIAIFPNGTAQVPDFRGRIYLARAGWHPQAGAFDPNFGDLSQSFPAIRASGSVSWSVPSFAPFIAQAFDLACRTSFYGILGPADTLGWTGMLFGYVSKEP